MPKYLQMGTTRRCGRDTFTSCEPVRGCTRFVPGTRPLTLPGQKKSLQKGPKADARTRTGDPFITSEVLYQLSYVGRGSSV